MVSIQWGQLGWHFPQKGTILSRECLINGQSLLQYEAPHTSLATNFSICWVFFSWFSLSWGQLDGIVAGMWQFKATLSPDSRSSPAKHTQDQITKGIGLPSPFPLSPYCGLLICRKAQHKNPHDKIIATVESREA